MHVDVDVNMWDEISIKRCVCQHLVGSPLHLSHFYLFLFTRQIQLEPNTRRSVDKEQEKQTITTK